MNRKILFFDIDDTLTSEKDARIPQSAIHAIEQARAQGHLIYINTGRCMQTVARTVREVSLDGYVCGCGTAVYDGQGREIWHFMMDGEAQKRQYPMSKLKDMAHRHEADFLVEGPEGMAFIPNGPILTEAGALHQRKYQECHYLFYQPEDPALHYDKYTIWAKTPEGLAAVMEASKELYTPIDRGMTLGAYMGEFVPKGYSKGTGVRKVCSLHGIPEEDSVVFGDSNNDLPMFETCGTKVAMGNCISEKVRALADLVTANASDDGIAKALKTLKLTGEA